MRRYHIKTDTPRARRPGFLSDLNDEQRRAVESAGGPMLVIAGAGTGKTRALVYRTAHLIDSGVDPSRILLLTFTNKAAREMIDRVTRLVPDAVDRVWAGTFHHIGNRILRREAQRIGYGNNFGIINGQEARDLMAVIIGELVKDVSARRFPKADVVLRMLSTSINTDKPLSEVIGEQFHQFKNLMPQIDQVLTTYLSRKVEMNLMDYDDLLINLRMLIEDNDDIKAKYADKFLHVLVDEYQDTNRLQAAIISMLCGQHRNIMAVGDDCQSIYRFRGADIDNILSFPKQFEGCHVYRLETNYRSTPEILEVANRSIKHNRNRFEKRLISTLSSGDKPAFVTVADGEQQALFVAQRVLELRDEGIELQQQVVLYRAHYQALELQLELQRKGIPFVVRSGLRFFEQGHIRDLLAHLKILFNPVDQLAWTRVLKLQTGVGNRHAFNIYQHLTVSGDPWRSLETNTVSSHLPPRARRAFESTRSTLLSLGRPSMASNPSAMIDTILASGYETYLSHTYANADQRAEDIRQLSSFAAQFSDYTDFLGELALVENVSAEDIKRGGESDEHLLLSTVHQAKGLEWDAVFLLSLAEGRFPLGRSLQSPDDVEEERRLFHVAITRARKELYLCHPQWGRDRERMRILTRPSRFLTELPVTGTDLVEVWQVSETSG